MQPLLMHKLYNRETEALVFYSSLMVTRKICKNAIQLSSSVLTHPNGRFQIEAGES